MRSIIPSIVFALFTLASCQTSSPEKKELTSGVIKQNMDTLLSPGDNFMVFVNGKWIRETPIPADKSSYSVGTIVHEESEENVRAIIDESAAGDFGDGSDEQKVGDLFKSFMDTVKREALGVTPLAEEFTRVDGIKSYDDLAAWFAYAVKFGYSAPLALFVDLDLRNPTAYVVNAWQSGLGLPDREYYLKTDARSKEIKVRYEEHVAKMWELCGLPDGKKVARTVVALEARLAEKQMEKEKTRDLETIYNRVDLKSLPGIMPDFNWSAFLKEVGVDQQDSLVVFMMDYTKALNNIIKSTPLDSWKQYCRWKVIDAQASNLTKALDDQNFAFYSKELYGTQEQRPMWRRGVTVVNGNLGEIVGRVYVKKHFPPEAKQRMQTMVDNLLKAYGESIKGLDWMGAETKMQALDKLSKFRPKIGYPDKWRDYSGLTISENDYYGNIKNSTLFEHNRQLNKLGKPIDKEEWGMTPQTVNAYYNPTLNEIVFPAAILQAPFFDMSAEDAVNYGAIGAVIGHEIGHGFDDTGSTFDGDGVMRNWWTDSDKEEFKKRTGALVSQYNAFEVLPGVNVNGEFTLGENIGDLGGLSIALKAYKMSLNGQEGPVMDGYTAVQRVFIGYGQVWRGKARDEALRVQVSTDPHSPRTFRVNGVVRNVPEFYEAFNVQPDDTLYLAPNARVKIW